MRSFRLDPYLWVHLAGLAAVPLWLDICLLGLATGEPVLPTWLELGWVAGAGVLPVAWMQWRRPFCIFSLVFLSLRPDRLSEDRRRLLRLFKDPLVKFVTALAPIPLLWALNKLYMLAPLAADLTPFGLGGRWLGLLVAAIAFLLANLFVQVPLSVVRVLLTPQRVFDQLPPYAPEQVRQDFTLLGIRINQILPDWQVPTAASSAASVSATNLHSTSKTALPVNEPAAAPVASSESVLDEVAFEEAAPVEAPASETISAAADFVEVAAVEAVESTSDEAAFDNIDPAQTVPTVLSPVEDPASIPEPVESGTDILAEGGSTAAHPCELSSAEPEVASSAGFSTADSLASPAATPELEETAQIPDIATLAEEAADDLEALADEAAAAAQPAQLEQPSGDRLPESDSALEVQLHTAEQAAASDAADETAIHADQSIAGSPAADSHSDDKLLDEPLAIAVDPYIESATLPEVSDPPPTHQG